MRRVRQEVTPDLAARKVIVNAYLYYVLDAPLLSDAEYDRLSELAAAGWSELHPDRQWALGAPEEVRATGHHIKFSSAAVSAARRAYSIHQRREPPVPPPVAWRTRDDGVSYVTTGD